jgi:hypothetical protein
VESDESRRKTTAKGETIGMIDTTNKTNTKRNMNKSIFHKEKQERGREPARKRNQHKSENSKPTPTCQSTNETTLGKKPVTIQSRRISERQSHFFKENKI